RGGLSGGGPEGDQPAMQGVGAGVLDFHAVHAAGEVPGAETGDARRLYLAVEAMLDRTIGRGLGADHDRLRYVDRERCAGRGGLAFIVDGVGAFQRLLANAQHAGGWIGARPYAIPGARAQLLAGEDRKST